MIRHTPKGDFIVLCCLDGYEPELAPLVVEAVKAVHDSETVGCVVKVMVEMAKLEWALN